MNFHACLFFNHSEVSVKSNFVSMTEMTVFISLTVFCFDNPYSLSTNFLQETVNYCHTVNCKLWSQQETVNYCRITSIKSKETNIKSDLTALSCNKVV